MDEDQVFTTEAIRDITTHDSAVSQTGEFTAKTIHVENELDKNVTIQLQGSRDKTVWVDMGNAFTIDATENDFDTVTDYYPFYRVTAKCSTAPTTGTLNVWILKLKG